jgi:hypothetical protein
VTRNGSRPQGILLGIGTLAVIAAGFIASAVPAGDPGVRFGVLVATVFTFTALCGVWAAPIGVAVIGFLVFDGFLVNRFGELTWHGPADLTRAVALVAALAFGRLAGDVYRAVHGRRAEPARVNPPRPLLRVRHDA